MYLVYILFSEITHKYYVGHTSNIEDRLARHNQGRSKSTKSGIPWKLMYTETFELKGAAYNREMEIKKKKSKIYIENLIAKNKG